MSSLQYVIHILVSSICLKATQFAKSMKRTFMAKMGNIFEAFEIIAFFLCDQQRIVYR